MLRVEATSLLPLPNVKEKRNRSIGQNMHRASKIATKTRASRTKPQPYPYDWPKEMEPKESLSIDSSSPKQMRTACLFHGKGTRRIFSEHARDFALGMGGNF
jgi:hypothetical protein